MNLKILRSAAFALLAALVGLGKVNGATPPSFQENRRVVFLGDSITYAGTYIDYLETYFVTRFPEHRMQFLNLGLPSETVSGLSEPGHAGGAFPRPSLHERLDRILQKAKPDYVVACYGMNDGIYYPFSEERFAKYQKGIEELVTKVKGTGAEILLLTPPSFDPVPLAGKTLPLGRDTYPEPYEGYNEVLDRYSDWLLRQRKKGWRVIDVHGRMNKHLASLRIVDPKYRLAGDGVHVNEFGHWLIAEAILEGFTAPKSVPILNLRSKKTRNPGKVPPTIDLYFTSYVPMPTDERWDHLARELESINVRLNHYVIKAKAAKDANYTVFDENIAIGAASGTELREGLDLDEYPRLSTQEAAQKVLKLVHKKQRLLTDAWLTETGHKRPGMAKGEPLPEAIEQAQALDRQIQEAARPREIHLGLVPERKR